MQSPILAHGCPKSNVAVSTLQLHADSVASSGPTPSTRLLNTQRAQFETHISATCYHALYHIHVACTNHARWYILQRSF